MKRALAIAAIAVLALPAVDARAANSSVESLASQLASLAPGLRPEVLQLALDASQRAAARGLVKRS